MVESRMELGLLLGGGNKFVDSHLPMVASFLLSI